MADFKLKLNKNDNSGIQKLKQCDQNYFLYPWHFKLSTGGGLLHNVSLKHLPGNGLIME